MQTISKQKEEKKDLGIKNIRFEPNQNVNDLEKELPISLLEIVVSLVPSISKLGNCNETQYNEQTNLIEVVEQLLIDFNRRNLNNRCRNGQDYDYENLMKNNSNVNIPFTSLVSPIQKQLTWSHIESI
jgi:ribosome-binding ATPase YchF (GTP1/OBG family)